MRQVIPKQDILDYYIPISPLTVKGGVVRVIDSATGDIDTTGEWIEDEKYKNYFLGGATSKTARFDTTVTRNGHKTVKNTVITKGDSTYIFTDTTPNIVNGLTQASKYAIPLKPSTNYRASIYSKCNGVGTGDGVRLRCYSIKSDGSAYDTYTSTTGALKGTQDWTELAVTFTTGADRTVFRAIYNLVEGADILDGQQVWSDIYSLKVEEISSITNSSSSPALYYPKLTAVTSTGNIDQSQVTSNDLISLGNATQVYVAQQFLPTKKNLTGVVVRKSNETGTHTGNVIVSIQADATNVPSGIDLGTPVTIPNATWDALTTNTDYTVSLPSTLNLTIDGSTKYWFVVKSSTADASNYTSLNRSTTDTYTSGLTKYSADAVTWSVATGKDLYFKTLYSKNTTNLTVSTDTETVSVTAPTTDGWADGTVVEFTDALTLAPGANAIYVSSNGQTTADGTVDSSLQGVIGGTYDNSAYPNPELNVRRTGYALLVENFRHIGLSLSTKDSANMTVKFQISNSREIPDFSAARSVTNRWEYVSVKDLQSTTAIDGDTGVSFNGTDDVRIFEINTNGQRWISATITDYVTGTIKLSAISLTN